MSRVSFLYLGLLMFSLFALQSDDLFRRMLRGTFDLGSFFTTRWTLITVGMLLSWFCLRVTL